MNKKVSDFYSGRTNFLMLYDENGKPAMIKERDDLKDKNAHLFQEFILDDSDKEYRALWNKYFRNYFGEYKEPDNKPKSMGGKKPYAMLMTEEVKNLLEKNIKNVDEVLGFLTILSGYMEFHTGKLIDKRQRLKKKQLPLQYNDLLEVCKYSRTKLDKMLKTAKEYNLIYYEKPLKDNSGGYFISSNIIKKGKKGVIE
jgi:hypothetical protein